MDTSQTILISPNDKKQYKALTLENGMRALLIHSPVDQSVEEEVENDGTESMGGDEPNEEMQSEEIAEGDSELLSSDRQTESKKTKLAAVCLTVNVGSFSDTTELQGLAHFLEHMISMGSTKYPDENKYEQFLSVCGGYSNAHTDLEETSYYFEVTPKHLRDVLDIFVSFFISPLLRVESMDRELEAVDGEFINSVPSDRDRLTLLLASFAKSGHPISKFNFGNTETLKDIPKINNIDVNLGLKEFYKRYYSAEHMALVVQSTDSLETLETWVVELFSQITNNHMPLDTYDNFMEPFSTEIFNKIYKVIPVKNTHEIHITFALSPSLKLYRIKPLDYIEFCVAHEGKGSILSVLRKRSWAVALVAGYIRSGCDLNSTCSKFAVKITLTETGMDHVFEIISLVFQYIKMLRTESLKKYIFEELRIIKEKSFEFMEERSATDNVVSIACNMLLFPPEHYLCGDQLVFDYDEKVIKSFIDEFVLDRANIMIVSSNFTKEECPENEKWMKGNYGPFDISSDVWESWRDPPLNPDLYLPEPNKFLATDFKLKHKEGTISQYPVKILEDDLCSVYFKGDTKFKIPKAYVCLHFISPETSDNPVNAAMNDLFLEIINQMLSEELYGAAVAEIEYVTQSSIEGFILKICGFNHKLHLVLETMLDYIVRFPFEDEMFESIKTFLMKSYYNFIIKPGKLIKEVGSSILLKVYYTRLERLSALRNVTKDMLRAHVKKCFETAFVEGLFQGNIVQEEVLSMMMIVKEKLNLKPLSPEKFPKTLILKLNEGSVHCCVKSFNKDDDNSTITNYYQIGRETLSDSCLLQMLIHYMWEPCFTTLRTQELLGYVVGCALKSYHGILGFVIFTQTPSTKFSSRYVDTRIESFLRQYLKTTSEIDEKAFSTQLYSYIQLKKTEDLCLQSEVDRNWVEFLKHKYFFNRREKEVTCLEQIKVEDLRNFSARFLDACKRCKLSLQVIAPHDKCLAALGDTSETDCAANDNFTLDKDQQKDYFLKFINNAECLESSYYVTDIKTFKETLEVYEDERN